MSGSVVEVIESNTTPRMGRRSMALSDIDPKYVSQSGIWEASEVETSRGSIRIQHLTTGSCRASAASSAGGGQINATHHHGIHLVGGGPFSGASVATAGSGGSSTSIISAGTSNVQTTVNPRFPKLEECAHFHYDCVELPSIKIRIRDDPSKPISLSGEEIVEKCAFSIEVVAGGQSWAIRRTHNNIWMLDSQLHRCVWDRTFSLLQQVEEPRESDQTAADHNSDHQHNGCSELVAKYLARLSELPINKITCGTVLSWLELDNRGRHIVSSDDSAINTPAVAAACAVKKYVSQAADEISFEVGDMISVIDMPPPEESIWWRGKRGFHVGFFPRDYVQVIGDKVPAGLPIVPSVRRLQRLSISSSSSSSHSSAPDKPVLRKHGKLIAFFRSFILSRPSRRRLKQSGILRERVFSCDLAEHLLNSGNEIPTVLRCCSEFIEIHGIVDGVYRLSGITSNIQKLRNAFDEDKIPKLDSDPAIKQDIHAVSSLLKMYFRELPNPLCTYQLYEKFVNAAKESDEDRLFKMREVVHELPPPHYRTLEFLMKHLSRVADRSKETGMTPKNMAIVWAPNLIRCKELESGGVAALKGIGVQAVVTEYLIRHADLIFNDKLPANFPVTTTVLSHRSSGSSSTRPKSLALSSPIKLMSLDEAQDKARDDRKYIEVGGGPASLPPKYHTVIELPGRRGAKSKRSPLGWRNLFSRNRSFSKPQRKMFTPGDITVITRNMPVAGPQGMQTNWTGRLRPVKSVESLVSSPLYNTNLTVNGNVSGEENGLAILNNNGNKNEMAHKLDSESVMEEMEAGLSKSSPASPTAASNGETLFPHHHNPTPFDNIDPRSLQNPKTHNRSISHDSYFEFGEFRNGNQVYIDETVEEETLSQSSKQSMDLSSSDGGENSPTTSPVKGALAVIGTSSLNFPSHCKSPDGRSNYRRSPVTPPPSLSSSIQESCSISKWRDSEVQTSNLKLSDVGVSTDEVEVSYLCSSQMNNNNNNNVDASVPSTSTPLSKSSVSIGSCQTASTEDKNSDSSELSTPDEALSTTNIIYSPLINEVSSVSSTEQLNFAADSLSSTPRPTSCSTVESATTSEQDPVASAKSSKTPCLFVCPLYEAGISSEEFTSPEREQPVTVFPPSPRKTEKEERAYENVKIEAKPAPVSSPPPYENVVIESCSSSVSTTTTAAPTTTAAASHPSHSRAMYANERIYENHPVAPVRKRFPINLNCEDGCGTEEPSSDNFHPVPKPKPKPKAKEPLPPSCTENIYERGEEHYENISETHSESEAGDAAEEANIYEDIDEDEEGGKPLGESKDGGDYSGSCKYEMVQVPNCSREEGSNSSATSAVETGRKNVLTRASPLDEEMEEEEEDYYDERNYESIRFQKIDNQPHPIAHHYAEIEERSPSTATNSRTEEIVTYLEAEGESQTPPPFKLRSSGEEEEEEETSMTESDVGKNNGSELQLMSSPEEEEIRFIDSPLVVENPVYTLTEELGNEEEDVSLNESVSLGEEDRSGDGEHAAAAAVAAKIKLLGRCNSAPLANSLKLSSSGLTAEERKKDCGGSADLLSSKISLAKRLSEPSLLGASSGKKSEELCDNTASLLWKLADAKRLSHRKQSVKELLCKFESRESTPSPNSSNGGQGSGFNSLTFPLVAPPGLPKPGGNNVSKTQKKLLEGKNCEEERIQQHHRFSMGDILDEKEMAEANGADCRKQWLTMSRSDTFPELRPSASKAAMLFQKENLQADSKGDSVNNGMSDGMVPEKMQNAIRVAMSSVDMNDPSTRERIEKYKEERRTILRQKLSSSESQSSGLPSSIIIKAASGPTNNGPLDKSVELSSFDRLLDSSVSSTSSNNPGVNNLPFNNNNNNNSTSSSSVSEPSTPSSNSCEKRSSCADSPRKRAFSEDLPPAHGNLICKSKSSKTEPLMSIVGGGGGGGTSHQDEINVKEKIALWTMQKTQQQQQQQQQTSRKSVVTCAELPKVMMSSVVRSSSKNSSKNLEYSANRPTSMPLSSISGKPILRREVTSTTTTTTTTSSSSLEISKCKVTRVEGSGKKIKDMAAFFEGKRL